MEKQRHEKRRKRKKKILNLIREQIEFYFSDANLRHDKYMRQLTGAEDSQLKGKQFVDLNEFLKFNKISEMTKKIRDIRLSLESSKCLSLDSDQISVKRIEPFLPKESTYFDDKTIYVERLPPNADQQWIRSIFGTFGRIEYIKIPHFRHNHNIMGFAFIEFSEQESAQKAVKHFNNFSSNYHKKEIDSESDSNLNQISVSSESESQPKSEAILKRSHDSEDMEGVPQTKRIKTSDESETIQQKCDTKEKKKKKRKRKRKKVTEDPNEDNEFESMNLRVMSKKEWKRWKKQYMELQKQTMSSIKRSLLIDSENKSEEQIKNQINKNEDKSENKREYERGLIIKLKFSLLSKDLNENDFKRNIRQIGGRNEIQYIDLPINQLEFCDNQMVNGICFIRTNSCEVSKKLVQNPKLTQIGELSLLEGNEETDYWNQIFDQRIKIKSNNEHKTKNKVRGFDRIIRRAENVNTNIDTKPNKHIKFETNTV